MTKVTIKPKNNPTTEVLHEIGNWYRSESGKTLAILANVKGRAVLITTNGDFWGEPVNWVPNMETGSEWAITQEQFNAVAGGDKFTLVPNITISEE